MDGQTIIVTGANGFLGSEIIRFLYEDYCRHRSARLAVPIKIVCVVRERFGLSPSQRMERVYFKWLKAGIFSDQIHRDFYQDFLQRIICVDWSKLSDILIQCDDAIIIHAAADTAFDLSLEESRRINVGLTEELLDKIKLAIDNNPTSVQRLIHISTAFVAGKLTGLIFEPDRFDKLEHEKTGKLCSSRFHNTYEQSKLESEILVRGAEVPWTIVRPAIVVGDSRTGFTLHFRVIYSVIRLWLRDVVPRAPLDPKARVDIVPSDHVARVILGLAQLPLTRVNGKTVHICAGETAPGPVDIMLAASRAFGRPPLPLSPPWVLRLLLSRFVLRVCSHPMREILKTVAWHMPYLGSRNRVFDQSLVRELLGAELADIPRFSEYGDRLFEYCAKTSWGRKCSTST